VAALDAASIRTLKQLAERDRLYRVSIAPSTDLLREQAVRGGFPLGLPSRSLAGEGW